VAAVGDLAMILRAVCIEIETTSRFTVIGKHEIGGLDNLLDRRAALAQQQVAHIFIMYT